MDFYGNINLQENQLQQLVFASEIDFPVVPVVGRVVYKGFVLYMCVALNGGLPIWIPLTNKINTYAHTQAITSSAWTIAHNLTASTPVVKIYDNSNNVIIPDNINIIDSNNISVSFSAAISGTAIIMTGEEMPVSGIGVLAPNPVVYTQSFISLGTIVIKHNLGYYPIVRAFINNIETQPLSVIHDSIFQATVTFSTPQSGELRLV